MNFSPTHTLKISDSQGARTIEVMAVRDDDRLTHSAEHLAGAALYAQQEWGAAEASSYDLGTDGCLYCSGSLVVGEWALTRLGRREAKPEVTRVHEAGVAGAIARGELLFAVIDQDEDTVWGIGETAEEALADAKVWVAERREDAPAVDLRAVEIDPAAAQAVLDGCVEIAPFNQATTTLALRRDRIEIAR